MQKFRYRIPRYAVELPVRIDLGGRTVEGSCTQISCEGIQMELAEPLPNVFTGTAVIGFLPEPLEIGVRRVRSGAQQDVFRFIFESERQRMAVAQLVTEIAMQSCEPRLEIVR